MTMIALFPEHSSRLRPNRAATACAISQPTRDDPVNDSSAIRGSCNERLRKIAARVDEQREYRGQLHLLA